MLGECCFVSSSFDCYSYGISPWIPKRTKGKNVKAWRAFVFWPLSYFRFDFHALQNGHGTIGLLGFGF
jgi:hypothetical protein